MSWNCADFFLTEEWSRSGFHSVQKKVFFIIIFMIFQLILLVLLTPTKYCFQDQVTPPSDRLWVVNQTFTKLGMVYSDFL